MFLWERKSKFLASHNHLFHLKRSEAKESRWSVTLASKGTELDVPAISRSNTSDDAKKKKKETEDPEILYTEYLQVVF